MSCGVWFCAACDVVWFVGVVALCVCVCVCVCVSCGLPVVLCGLWYVLVSSGLFWSLPVSSGFCLSVLVSSGLFWSLLVLFGLLSK